MVIEVYKAWFFILYSVLSCLVIIAGKRAVDRMEYAEGFIMMGAGLGMFIGLLVIGCLGSAITMQP